MCHPILSVHPLLCPKGLLQVECQDAGGDDTGEHEEGQPGLEECCTAEGQREGDGCSVGEIIQIQTFSRVQGQRAKTTFSYYTHSTFVMCMGQGKDIGCLLRYPAANSPLPEIHPHPNPPAPHPSESPNREVTSSGDLEGALLAVMNYTAPHCLKTRRPGTRMQRQHKL